LRPIILVTAVDDLAADLVVLHLRRRGASFVRFNQEDFPAHVKLAWRNSAASATIGLDGDLISCADIRSAWFRYSLAGAVSAPQAEVDFVSHESAAFLTGFLEAMPWFWMNRPSAVAHAANKLQQLARASEFGFCLPRTLVTNSPHAARNFVRDQPSIVKTVAAAAFSQCGELYAVYTSPVTVDDLSDASVQAAPAIFQQRIVNECDLRVTVVGDRVFAVRILTKRRDGEVDWRALDTARISYERYALPAEIERRCVAFTRAFSLSFAALDFIVTPEGEHVFLEINPSGQWGWLEQATGLPISDAIVDRLIAGEP
jgi:glutathione synthase/RimK-type ligase-like ATP-grasp enzyme